MEQLPGFSAKLNELWFYKHDSIETYDLINEFLKPMQERRKYYEEHPERTPNVVIIDKEFELVVSYINC